MEAQNEILEDNLTPQQAEAKVKAMVKFEEALSTVTVKDRVSFVAVTVRDRITGVARSFLSRKR